MSSASSLTTIQKLYIAYYGRPADAGGREYWATELDKANGSLAGIIDNFASAPEAMALYGAGTSVSDRVKVLYQNILGRSADAAGLAYYVGEVTAGRLSLGNAALAILDGVQGADVTLAANRLTVADNFTSQVVDQNYGGDAAAAIARTFLKQVSGDAATITQANSQLSAYFNTLAVATLQPGKFAPLINNGLLINTAIVSLTLTEQNLDQAIQDVLSMPQTIVGTSDNDNLKGALGDDNISGLAGNDRLEGSGGNDTLSGGDGDDYLTGGAGNDVIDGNAGYNTVGYEQSPTGVTVNLALGTAQDGHGGTDTLRNIQGILGSAHNDRLTGGNPANGTGTTDGSEFFFGGAGDDIIDGGGGYDSAQYFSSTQGIIARLPGTGTGTVQDGLGGTDTLISIENIRASNFNDQITGSSTAVFESYEGMAGDDTIDGGVGLTDSVTRRVDYLSALTGTVVVLGGSGAGTAQDGAGGVDTLLNISSVRGGAFDDAITGSDTTAYTEQFEGLAGNDTIDGKGGTDIARYDRAPSAVTVNLALGTAQDGQGGTDTLRNIEMIFGSAFGDTLTGGNPLNGSGALDGFEAFRGNAGNDTIDGGTGYDRADYNTATRAVVVTLGGTSAGTAQDGLGGTDTLINIEAVRASSFDDTLTGSDSGAYESFEGFGGNDTIDGRGGVDRADYRFSPSAVNVDLAAQLASQDGYGTQDILRNIEYIDGSAFGDTLRGDASANRIAGNAGNDILFGGAGDDWLIGGAGADQMDGGDGSDTFIIGTAGSGMTVQTADTIAGFVSGSDKLSLGVAATDSNFVKATAASADFNAALAAANAAFAADAGGAKAYVFHFDGTQGYLFIDRQANGSSADEVIVLTGLNNTNFAMTDIVV